MPRPDPYSDALSRIAMGRISTPRGQMQIGRGGGQYTPSPGWPSQFAMFYPAPGGGQFQPPGSARSQDQFNQWAQTQGGAPPVRGSNAQFPGGAPNANQLAQDAFNRGGPPPPHGSSVVPPTDSATRDQQLAAIRGRGGYR